MSAQSKNALRAISLRRLPGMSRRGWMLIALAIIGTGMALSWGWLTAIGAAPLLLGLAPCAAMCALGLCMRGGPSACANKNAPVGKPDVPTD